MNDDHARSVLGKELDDAKIWGRKYRYLWSCATHGTAWTVPSLSAFAGILSGLDAVVGGVPLRLIATFLSAIVVVISSAQISVGFHRKWASYRRTQTEVRLLKIALDTGHPVEEIRKRLEEVYRRHDDEIIGDKPVA